MSELRFMVAAMVSIVVWAGTGGRLSAVYSQLNRTWPVSNDEIPVYPCAPFRKSSQRMVMMQRGLSSR